MIGCFNPFYFGIAAKCDAGVLQGIDYRGVAVAHGGIFSGDADIYLPIVRLYFVGKVAPLRPGLAFVTQIDSVFDF